LAQALLNGCPHLRILATSRQSLGIPGETLWCVAPLPVPKTGAQGEDRTAADRQSVEELAAYPAVQLLVQRAREGRSQLVISGENIGGLVEICRRVDGIPLAIELAAARLRTMSVEQIVERLGSRASFLASPYRTASPRHQTLWATLDWSHALLTPAERSLFRRLSIFSGGWTLEAAEAIGAGTESAGPAVETADVLMQLVDKSLVVASERGETIRFRLLEPVRQYARERMEEGGATAELSRGHAEYYLRLAEEAGARLRESDQALRLQQLEAEHDNVRAALDWLHTDGPPEGELRLTAAMAPFWALRGYVAEGRDRTEAALGRLDEAMAPEVQARGLRALALLLEGLGAYDTARLRHEASLALWRRIGGDSEIASCLNSLAGVLCCRATPSARASSSRKRWRSTVLSGAARRSAAPSTTWLSPSFSWATTRPPSLSPRQRSRSLVVPATSTARSTT
jgi:non-specific serine/threonine protein kinase